MPMGLSDFKMFASLFSTPGFRLCRHKFKGTLGWGSFFLNYSASKYFKGATKLYFAYYSCMVIIFYNTGVYKSAFFTYYYGKLVFRFSVFYVFMSVLSFQSDIFFAELI